MTSNEYNYAYLRIRGHGPSSEITKHLDLEPDDEWSEGDDWQDKEPNLKRFFTHWEIRESEGEDLNFKIRNILNRIKRKKNELLSISGNYDVCLVCVSYDFQSFSYELDFDLQRDLTAFGIRLWFDCYVSEDTHSVIQELKNEVEALKS